MSQEKSTMRFLFGDRELILAVTELLSAPVDVIVSPAERTLQHQAGVAGQIRQRAGDRLQQESAQLIKEYGEIDSGMAVYTSAGELPFKAIIHAVCPGMGEGDEQRKLEQSVSRSLQLCEVNEWRSVCFPLLSSEHAPLPIALCAQAFFRAITRFWDARHECVVEKVLVALPQAQFRPFFDAFREHGLTEAATDEAIKRQTPEAITGEVDLSDIELSEQDNADIDDWFK